MSKSLQRWGFVLFAAVGVVGALWGAWESWTYRRARRAMVAARAEIEAGRQATAARILTALLDERPDWDAAAYLLGTCEKATGRIRAAADAWARVPPGSASAPQAIQRLMELEVEKGQFAAAEELVLQAMVDARNDATALPLYLGPIYWLQGRIVEAEQAIEARWQVLNDRGDGASEKAIELVRLHIEIRRNPLPIDEVRQGLEAAGRLAPEDDRVWLGKANFAIRAGMYDQAEPWLVACIGRRPRDVAVWRARLDWAVATNRVEEAREAFKHLPVTDSTPAEVPRLAAWLAARRGDRESERRALERAIAADPTDFAATLRLAALAIDQGQTNRAAGFRQQKTEFERLQARYHELYQRYQPARDAAEMATLAHRLGQRFEARAFATLALVIDRDRDDLHRDLARLGQPEPPINKPGRTLADVIAAEQPTASTGG